GDGCVLAWVLEAGLGVVRDALHARLVACEAFGAAVAQEANEPAPLMRIEAWPQNQWRMAGEQPAHDVRRHSRRRPRTRKPRPDAAGIGETRLQGRSAPAVDHHDLMARLGEIIGRTRSNDAGAEHHHSHDATVLTPP